MLSRCSLKELTGCKSITRRLRFVLMFKLFGRFRWVYCQLEVLRYCLPPSVRHTLDELPETLDETYERVLKEIKKPNRVHAIRLLQCLVVAIRPLRVEELAEVLAVDFGDEERMPKLNPNWRWGDEEQALLSSCSSLIAIVESDEYRVVQFSHFSVKEYLTSARLATSSGDISRYHIDPVPAHTILTQACMAVLLRSDDRVEESGGGNISPLTGYAAKHWVVHAHDQKVSSCLRKAMEYLFDVDKPYFAAWLKLYDIDTRASEGSTFYWFALGWKSGATPLYYAARFGFQDLVEHLVACDPKQVNATGGYYVTPLVAALATGHFQTAEFLYQNGAHPNIRGLNEATALHSAAYYGDFEMVQILLKYKADVQARNAKGRTPLDFISESPYLGGPNRTLSFSNVTRLLLEHGADRAQERDHSTPLHFLAGAARFENVATIRMMLEHGVDVNARNNNDSTPLHEAARNGKVDAMRVLLDHGADVNARENDDIIPLHEAARNGMVGAIRLLLDHGADVNARKNNDSTPLHEAARNGKVNAIRVLLDHGADVNARTIYDTTPLFEAVEIKNVDAVRVLLEHGADVNTSWNKGTTPLHEAVQTGNVDVMGVLMEHGADLNARKNDDTTPLHVAAQYGPHFALSELLCHDVDVNARKNDGSTPLHEAVRSMMNYGVRELLEHGADVHARMDDDTTPLHVAAQKGTLDSIRVLLEHGANVGAEDGNGRNASQVASESANYNIMTLLSEYGAK